MFESIPSHLQRTGATVAGTVPARAGLLRRSRTFLVARPKLTMWLASTTIIAGLLILFALELRSEYTATISNAERASQSFADVLAEHTARTFEAVERTRGDNPQRCPGRSNDPASRKPCAARAATKFTGDNRHRVDEPGRGCRRPFLRKRCRAIQYSGPAAFHRSTGRQDGGNVYRAAVPVEIVTTLDQFCLLAAKQPRWKLCRSDQRSIGHFVFRSHLPIRELVSGRCDHGYQHGG